MKKLWLGMLAAMLACAVLFGALAEAGDGDAQEQAVFVEEVDPEFVESDGDFLGLDEQPDDVFTAEDDISIGEAPQATEGEVELVTYEMGDIWEAAPGAEEDPALAEASSTEIGLDVEYHTPEEIQAFVDAHPAYRYQPSIFRATAIKNPYRPAKLSEFTQNAAISMVNQMRYIAGIEADVEIDWDNEDLAAAAAFVNGLNFGLSHFPERPAVLSGAAYDALYSQGLDGSSSSNLYGGGSSATHHVLGYVSDVSNVTRNNVGHRLWVLSQSMKKAVFGACASEGTWLFETGSMYVDDSSRQGSFSRVAWPAQETPCQYFWGNEIWSVTLDGSLDASDIRVRLVRQSDGKTWDFSNEASDGYFGIQEGGYGYYWNGTLLFQPDGLGGVNAGDMFDVTVTSPGNGCTLRYSVHFFDMDLSAMNGLGTPGNTLALIRKDGNHVTWDAVSGATGYFVCRKVDDLGFEQCADVKSLKYVDKNVSADHEYEYAVYAHNGFMNGSPGTAKAQLPVPERVSIAGNMWSATLFTDETLKLSAQVEPSYAETTLTWSSSDTGVAKVDSTGLVRPVGKGSATISVMTHNGLTASIGVTVRSYDPEDVGIAENWGGAVALYPGDALQLTAQVYPDYARTSFYWSSSDPGVAAVDGGGLVTAMAKGSAIIGVTTDNGLAAAIRVNVVSRPKPSGIVLNYQGTLAVNVGEPLQLTAALVPEISESTIKWKSSNKKVAAVDANGLVTLKKAGKATITAKTANGKKAKLKLKVSNPYVAKKVRITQGKKATLRVGETLQLTAGLVPSTAQTTLKWKSSKRKVASVDANGLVTAKKRGTAKITVTTKNRKKATIRIKVVK